MSLEMYAKQLLEEFQGTPLEPEELFDKFYLGMVDDLMALSTAQDNKEYTGKHLARIVTACALISADQKAPLDAEVRHVFRTMGELNRGLS